MCVCVLRLKHQVVLQLGVAAPLVLQLGVAAWPLEHTAQRPADAGATSPVISHLIAGVLLFVRLYGIELIETRSF